MYEAQYLKTENAAGGSYVFEAASRHEARAKAKQVQKALGYGTLLRLVKLKATY